YRRRRGDLILACKILQGTSDPAICPQLNRRAEANMGGCPSSLCARLAKKGCRKYFHLSRAVSPWNSLPFDGGHASTLGIFKT
ncbi:hypothetical protein HELRODRAFT_66773, partial [Helobdella robusta]|uniref:Uncharacterized protein n=1 Tax=Helobdella robusta TaxID=6412 RepID=T1FYQ7_HELRO